MTLDRLPPRPELPYVPPPDPDPAHGWGMAHLTAWREAQRVKAQQVLWDAQYAAIEALQRDVALATAHMEHDRALAALYADHMAALDAPTGPVPPVPGPAPWEMTFSPPPASNGAHAAPEPPDEGNALPRAEEYVRGLLDAGAEIPTLRVINDHVQRHGRVKGHHVRAWREAWEREQGS